MIDVLFFQKVLLLQTETNIQNFVSRFDREECWDGLFVLSLSLATEFGFYLRVFPKGELFAHPFEVR